MPLTMIVLLGRNQPTRNLPGSVHTGRVGGDLPPCLTMELSLVVNAKVGRSADTASRKGYKNDRRVETRPSHIFMDIDPSKAKTSCLTNNSNWKLFLEEYKDMATQVPKHGDNVLAPTLPSRLELAGVH